MKALVGCVPSGGSWYVTDVLRACEISAEHEVALHIDPEKFYPHSHDVEVSYIANVWFPYFEGYKILLARPPLPFIRSAYSWGFLQNPAQRNNYIYEKFPRVAGETELRRLARFYIEWQNVGLQYCDTIWKVRNLTYANIRVLADNAKLARCDPTGLDRTVKGTNTKKHKWEGVEFDWSVLEPDLMPQLEEITDRLGLDTLW